MIKEILKGASLSVILAPDPSIQTDFPKMIETLDLRHIIISGNRFIGNTDNAHAVHYEFKPYNLKFSASYAYSNYANIVINSSYTENLCRYYHSSRYLKINFINRIYGHKGIYG